MVDLFGCGFIAAIFLFLANMMQPLIDARQAETAGAVSARGGSGLTGPVFVHLSSWPVVLHEWPEELPREPVTELAVVLPDAAKIRWPVRIAFEQAEADEPYTAEITLVVGSQAATVVVDRFIKSDGRFLVSLNQDRRLTVEVYGPLDEQFRAELLPSRKERRAFTNSFLVVGRDARPALFAWADKVSRVKASRQGRDFTIAPDYRGQAPCRLLVHQELDPLLSCGQSVEWVLDFVSEKFSRASQFVSDELQQEWQ